MLDNVCTLALQLPLLLGVTAFVVGRVEPMRVVFSVLVHLDAFVQVVDIYLININVEFGFRTLLFHFIHHLLFMFRF